MPWYAIYRVDEELHFPHYDDQFTMYLMSDETLVECPRLLELVGLEAADEVRRLEAERVEQRAQRDLELRRGGGGAPPARPPRVPLGKEHLSGQSEKSSTCTYKKAQVRKFPNSKRGVL